MSSFTHRLGVFLPLLIAACEAGVIASQPADAATDSATGDAATDGAATDGATGDSGGDAGTACPTYGDVDRVCQTELDCALVARGCYCGARPMIGVSKTVLALAASCEATVQQHCALGCANSPGNVAEDGQGDQDGGTIVAACDAGRCGSVLR